ncbi:MULTISPECIES: RNB domain-containing ribonuclease [unclassified Sphingomonas]|uniref:RNB domain-containing ribonuclease n=1 Tax=unclassified Sphingomonas TaxID=196159 RepID=UPI002150CAD3|nr:MULTISPECIES: RNB domain-containing ribonuclease [unclassified Sphingomonas]MCR5870139.1 RNB domain-containing ribonuclease [Sphingomonas sp. J344]UUX98169.1 RNB domain-containing ribonuclease [Sphingomonas sp. J315]
MKTLADPSQILTRELAAIRSEFQVPEEFPPEVLIAAERAARRAPSDHADWTRHPFVTLDPAHSTDLDQAFAIESAGDAHLLHYAIADIGWFVDPDGRIDAEAWRRGETLYLPDGKASLYPPLLSQGAASLLPDGPRPAVVFSVRVDAEGTVALDAVTRAVIRSRAKLAYATVTEADLPPGFTTLTDRLIRAEAARGAAQNRPARAGGGRGRGRAAHPRLSRAPSQRGSQRGALARLQHGGGAAADGAWHGVVPCDGRA